MERSPKDCEKCLDFRVSERVQLCQLVPHRAHGIIKMNLFLLSLPCFVLSLLSSIYFPPPSSSTFSVFMFSFLHNFEHLLLVPFHSLIWQKIASHFGKDKDCFQAHTVLGRAHTILHQQQYFY